MRYILLAFFVLSSVAFGQNNVVQPPMVEARPRIRTINSSGDSQSTAPSTLSENYILTLTATEKDKPATEYSLVVAAPTFALNPGGFSFSGTIRQEEGGSFLINYNINSQVVVTVQNNQQYQSIGMDSAVRLRPADPVQIYKSDERSYKLTLTPVSDEAKKK